MNAKIAKRVRRSVRNLDLDWRQREYKILRRREVGTSKVTSYVILDPNSGRAVYKRIKRLWDR